MIEEIKAIGQRIRGLRDACDVSLEELALALDIPSEELSNYECGEQDISVGLLHAIARYFKVELNALLTGEESRLTSYTLTRKGEGMSVSRRPDYQYKSLAFTFANRSSEPFIVRVEPTSNGNPIPLNAHVGQEFNYVISGSLFIKLGDTEFILNEGDSLYYDSSIPHGMKALDGTPAEFLAIISSN